MVPKKSNPSRSPPIRDSVRRGRTGSRPRSCAATSTAGPLSSESDQAERIEPDSKRVERSPPGQVHCCTPPTGSVRRDHRDHGPDHAPPPSRQRGQQFMLLARCSSVKGFGKPIPHHVYNGTDGAVPKGRSLHLVHLLWAVRRGQRDHGPAWLDIAGQASSSVGDPKSRWFKVRVPANTATELDAITNLLRVHSQAVDEMKPPDAAGGNASRHPDDMYLRKHEQHFIVANHRIGSLEALSA